MQSLSREWITALETDDLEKIQEYLGSLAMPSITEVH